MSERGYPGLYLDSAHGLPWLEASNLTVSTDPFGKGSGIPKIILNGVSLEINSGEMVALLGPSGAGKSTLVRLLSGRASTEQGIVTLHNLITWRSQMIGRALAYLDQDDVLHGELSVRQALTLTAAVRQPEKKRADILQAVDQVMAWTNIHQLGALPLNRLSGGERRRANLCAELLSESIFLFLDEPTANLDPHHSRELLKLVRDITYTDGEARAIVVVTHDIWHCDLFDRIIFLVDGYLVFCGLPEDATAYFNVDSLPELYEHFELYNDKDRRRMLAERAAGRWDRWTRRQERRTNCSGTQVERTRRSSHMGMQQPQRIGARPKMRQFTVLVERLFHNTLKDRLMLFLFVAQPVVGALLILALTDRESLVASMDFGLGAMQVSFTLVMMAVVMGLVNSHRSIVREQVIFHQEQSAGLRPGPYLLSKLAFLGTLSLAQIALMVFIIGLSVRYPTATLLISSHIDMIVSLALCAVGNIGVGLFLSSLARTSRQATLLLVPLLTAELVMGGLLFELSNWPGYLARLMPSIWAYQALGTMIDINQFNPYIEKPDPMFLYTAEHLLTTWGALMALAMFYTILAWGSLEVQRRRRLPKHLQIATRGVLPPSNWFRR